MTALTSGDPIYALARELFPICRSITGDGVRSTLRRIQKELPSLRIEEMPTGTHCFDWTVPREWNIRDAYVIDPSGNKIIDFRSNNLHVLGYSMPIDGQVDLEELKQHLYSLPEQPEAIPYMTSYYQERWGFCLSHQQRQSLKPGKYRVKIDSELKDGSLTFGELLLPGQTRDEIFLSTYVCHPSLGNNELSGPCVTTYLSKWLAEIPRRTYSYRIVFIPETIGSIAYLSLHSETMKERVKAGFNVTCVGDNRTFSFLPSRNGNSLSDKVANHVLHHVFPGFKRYSFLDRGSDERQYCSPGIDLPVATVMRSKYGEYPEYHTSLDNLDLISPEGLWGTYQTLLRCLECLEANCIPKVTVLCEPQLGKRGLYPTLSAKESWRIVRAMMDLLAYSDGTRSLLDIAMEIDRPMWELIPVVERLRSEGLIEVG